MVNFDKDNETINSIQYLLDKNNFHDNKSYDVGLFP